jgi:ribosome-associated translation inhibitor RaiA
MTDRLPDDVVFVLDGPVDPRVKDHADALLDRLAGKAPRPVIFARFKMMVEEGRVPEQRAVAQATVDVSGALIRAQVAAPTVDDALNVLEERLGRRLRRLAERRQDAEQRPPRTPPGQWRHDDLPDSRPSVFPRPPEEREIVRHKTFGPEAITPEEAVFDLDVLDYRFFLFTDVRDGADSVVYETDGDVRLRRIGGDAPPEMAERPLPVEIDPTPAPRLTTDEAVEHLDVSGAPFVFYEDAESGRGMVVYRRLDGHYGAIRPAG